MSTKLLIRQQMNISPQLVITGRLLQVPGSELEQFINREVETNPALELVNKPKSQRAMLSDRSATRLSNISKSGLNSPTSLEEFMENIAQRQSPLERLIEQVAVTPDRQDRDIAIALLHRLDHRGYLVTPTEQLAAELGVSSETVIRARQILHKLEPPGIGAGDIRECFLIQCIHLEGEGTDCQRVQRILTLAWDEFLNRQWARVAKKIGEPKRLVEEACDFMRSNLYPYPLALMETTVDIDETLKYADLIIRRAGPVEIPMYSLEIPGAEDFELKVSPSFERIPGTESQDGHLLSLTEKTWIRTHVDRALMMTFALRQRWETLRRIGEHLIECQQDFLEHGPLHLKPLTRAMLAQQLNMQESTISRAVRDKIVQLPDGRLIPLSDFFDASLSAKEAIRVLLRKSSGQLCDREIAKSLQGKGIQLSRRTVTKYRREINIGSSRRHPTGI